MQAALVLVLVGLLSAASDTRSGIEGSWLTDDGKAVVTIRPCGPKMCGYIAKVLNKDPSVPTTDVKNADPRLRGRPILGMSILTGFTPAGNVWKGGRAYDPKTGRSYRSTLGLNGDGSLKVTGCVLFICQSQRWTRTH